MPKSKSKPSPFKLVLAKNSLQQYTVRDQDNNDCGQFDTLDEAIAFVREDLENNPADGYTLYIDKLVAVGTVHKPEPLATFDITLDPEA